MKEKILILVDYSWCCHRYRHVHQQFTSIVEGEEIFTGGAFGFTTLISSIHRRFRETDFEIIFCMDQNSDRKKENSEYKANREHQVDVYKEDTYITSLISMVNFTSLTTSKEKEADDVMAYLAIRNRDKYDKVYIYSGDNDMLQLMKFENIFVTREFSPKGFVTITEEYVHKKFGDITIPQILYMRALLGDPSDNIAPPSPDLKKAFLREFIKIWETEGLDSALEERHYQHKIKGIKDNLSQLNLLQLSRSAIISNYRLMSLLRYEHEDILIERYRVKQYPSLVNSLKLTNYEIFLENLNNNFSGIKQISL